MGRDKPECPCCITPINWKFSFRIWNPWSFSCPNCSQKIEMSRFVKALYMLSIPLGICYGLAPAMMEEYKIWHAGHSFAYFCVTIPVMLFVSYMVWPNVHLYKKNS
jgi:hypothetical protein